MAENQDIQKNYDSLISYYKSLKNTANTIGMAKYGINTENALGISMIVVRETAKKIKKNHELALKLWNSNIHEAKILASIIAEPKKTDEKLLNTWVKTINSWDLCDQCCLNLFSKTSFAHDIAQKWCLSDEVFIKRAGFSLIAILAVHDKKINDDEFLKYFDLIINNSDDNRNFVKKSVNWALRSIGKRSLYLNSKAIEVSEIILIKDDKISKWIANDTIKELTNDKIKKRIKR